MHLGYLKELINTNKLNFTCLVFEHEGLDLVTTQYLQAIASLQSSTITYIEDLKVVPTTSIFNDSINTDVLYVYKVDEIKSLTRYSLQFLNNVIIITKKMSKDVKESLKSLNYLVEFPKLESWHVVEYIKTLCPGLKNTQVDWVVKNYGNNYSGLLNQIDKIEKFDKALQAEIFDMLYKDGSFDVADSGLLYQLINTIIKRDLKELSKLNKTIRNNKLLLDPFLIISTAKRSIKNVIDVQLVSGITAERLGMKQNQFNAIKWNANKYSEKELAELYKFVNSIDFKIKNGMLMLDNGQLTDYIINKLSEYCL